VAQDGIVEPELAEVAQLQDRQADEGLGDRGDAEERVGIDGARRSEIAVAEAGGPDELLIAHDAQGQAGHALLPQDLVHPRREGGDDRVDGAIGHGRRPQGFGSSAAPALLGQREGAAGVRIGDEGRRRPALP